MHRCKFDAVYIFEGMLTMEAKRKVSLAEKLVRLRKEKGLTQMELAGELHVSRQAISRWEVGYAMPGMDNLKILSELYEVSVDFLLNDNLTESSECRQDQKNAIVEIKSSKKTVKYKIFVICMAIIVLVIAVMAGALVPRSRDQDQVVPMEEMCTGSDDGYAEGTFMIK